MKTILVTYASKHGATYQIAQAINKVLRKHHFQVHLIPVGAVDSIEIYDAVILGSAVYMGAWLEDAMDFLKVFDVALQEKRVWLFSSGPTGQGDTEELLAGWQYPEAIEGYVERIMPEDIVIFHGKLELDVLPLWQKWLIRAMKSPLGDYRQWGEIQAWAENIAQALEPQLETA